MNLPRISRLVTRPILWLGLAVLIGSFFMPRSGFAPSQCGFYLFSGEPCFGCGMTRALSNFSQLDFARAWDFHAFVFILWPMVAWCALAAVIPPLGRWTLALVARHDVLFTRIFWAVFAIFGLHGLARMIGWVGFPVA